MVKHDACHPAITERVAPLPSPSSYVAGGVPWSLAVLLLLLTMLAASTAAAQASDSLDVMVDRNTLYESETLSLTIKGETELELSLDALMNLRSLDLPEPDIKDLRVDFDVLDQRQSYSLRSINGEHSAEITWTYQLAPRRAGELTIPAISFKGTQSSPRTIEVKPGSPAQTDSADRPAWVEASINKDRAFIQEQLVLTLRLFYEGSLISGDLTEPELGNAILEPLGDQSQRSEFIDGKRYQMVERRYLIYPQRSGELEIPAQRFTGRQRDPVTGALRFLRAQSEPLQVEVLPPPADFPGDRWVAAESLVLSESWSRPPETIRVGDSLTRVLNLRTLGLLESAIPVLEVDYPSEFKAYPEGPRSESEINAGTVEASQSQTTALVAVKPGEVTLPETRLHWWDTLNNQARVAVIPERTLTILPAPGATAAATDGNPEVSESQAEAPKSPPAPAGLNGTPSALGGLNPWIAALAGFFALAWLATLLLWHRTRQARSQAVPAPEERSSPGGVSFEQLKQHALAGRVETLQAFPAWVREAFGRPSIRTLRDARAFFDDQELAGCLDELERYHFGADQGRQGAWQRGQALVSVLERLRKSAQSSRRAESALPPFRKVPG